MKIVVKLLMLYITVQASAQIEIPLEDFYSPGFGDKRGSDYYYKDSNGILDKFIGTWRYQTDTELFEVTFSKRVKNKTGMGYYDDDLAGNYKYIKNGQVIYDTYSTIPGPDTLTYFIFGRRIKKPNLEIISLLYNEPEVRSGPYDSVTLKHEYISRDRIEVLQWKVSKNILIVNFDKLKKPRSEFKVPWNMSLTKVE